MILRTIHCWFDANNRNKINIRVDYISNPKSVRHFNRDEDRLSEYISAYTQTHIYIIYINKYIYWTFLMGIIWLCMCNYSVKANWSLKIREKIEAEKKKRQNQRAKKINVDPILRNKDKRMMEVCLDEIYIYIYYMY